MWRVQISPARTLAPAAIAVAFAASCFAAPRPLILTTDCGADMDDQWAIAHLLSSPQVDVRAIVTTHTGKHNPGPAASERSATCARDVMAHLSHGTRPNVIAGSAVQLAARAPLANSGVERIISDSRAFDRNRRLTVLVIGAATDTASALLSDPSLADRIEIVAMGFQSWTAGGDEFNIQNDPLAWQVILDSTVPVTVGDGAVCRHDLSLTSAGAHAALDRAGAPGRYAASLLDNWLTKHPDIVKSATGDTTAWPVWDEVTVAHLLGFTKEEERPRPHMRDDLSFDHSATSGTIRWITAVDGTRLWADLAKELKGK